MAKLLVKCAEEAEMVVDNRFQVAAIEPAIEAGREHCRRLELKGRRKSHRLTVESDLRNHISPFFGATPLDRITAEASSATSPSSAERSRSRRFATTSGPCTPSSSSRCVRAGVTTTP